ncbi:MAG: hypothetical protein ACI9IA_002233, partial [Enterobacterales bacterium]
PMSSEFDHRPLRAVKNIEASVSTAQITLGV